MEALVVPIVNRILGEYISNLESKQLDMSLWSGQVKLHNLLLRKDMFRNQHIPLDVHYGTIDHLTLSIPWNDLRNKPLKIYVENVFILAKPYHNTNYDPVAEEFQMQELKKKKLREAEENLAESLKDKKQTYFSQIGAAIVDNLQISIKNIHFRFEDTTSQLFGLGFTLQELSAASCDSNWKVGSKPSTTNLIYKLLVLGYFGIYCSTDSMSYMNGTPAETRNRFLNNIPTTTETEPVSQFILNPVSGVGKLIWSKKYDPKFPLYELFANFDKFAINLDNEQYQTFLDVFDTISRAQLAYPNRKFRPPHTISVKMDPKAWFQYAIKCVVEKIHKKRYQWSWDHFAKRRAQRKLYIDLHTKLRQETIMVEELEQLEELEWGLEYDDIRFYRHLAMKEIGSAKPQKESNSNAGWFGWITSPNAKDDNQEWNRELKKLYDKFEFEDIPNTQTYPADYIKIRINCQLQAAQFNLKSIQNGVFLELVHSQFDNMRAEYVGYPNSSNLIFKMKDLFVLDPLTNAQVVKSKSNSSNSEDFMLFEYSNNPLNNNADNSLKIRMQPLIIFMNATVLKNALQIFQSPVKKQNEQIDRLQAVAQNAFKDMKSQTRAGLIFAIEEHKSLFLDIEASAPIFIFPSHKNMQNHPLLILDAGHLKIKSNLANKENELQTEILLTKSLEELSDEIYDKFTIELNNSNAFLTDYNSVNDFKFGNPNYIVENIDIEIICEVCILIGSSEFTMFKLSAGLKRLHLNLSEFKVKTLKNVVDLISDTFKSDEIDNEPDILLPELLPSDTANEIDLTQLLNSSGPETFEEIVDSASTFQKIMEIAFSVGTLSVMVSKSSEDAEIALFEVKDIIVGGYMTPRDKKLEASLGSFIVIDRGKIGKDIMLVSPEYQGNTALLKVDFHSMIKKPEEHINTSIVLMPIKFVLVRDCVIKLVQFFDSFNSQNIASSIDEKRESQSTISPKNLQQTLETKINVGGISIHFADGDDIIGACFLNGIQLTSISREGISIWNGNTGKLFLYDGPPSANRTVLILKEDQSINVTFETFPEGKSRIKGYDSILSVHSSSWKFIYDHRYLNRISEYFSKMKEMKYIMDNASKAAQESSMKIKDSAGRFYFEISIDTPIIEIPNGSNPDSDGLILYPGSVSASNGQASPNSVSDSIENLFLINVVGMKVQSVTRNIAENDFYLDMVEDINIKIRFEQLKNIPSGPNSILYADFSDINIKVTDHQYKLAVQILQLMTDSNSDIAIDTNGSFQNQNHTEYFVNIPNLVFEAFITPTKFDNPSKYSLTQLRGSGGKVNIKLQPAKPMHLEMKFNGLSVVDTRTTKNNVFRDMMVSLERENDQFFLKYENSPILAEYEVIIEHPKLILEIDHLLALQAFAMSAFYREAERNVTPIYNASHPETREPMPEKRTKGKVKFVDAEIILVVDPENLETEAVIMISKDLLITQDGIINLSFCDLGLNFCQMNKRQETQYRFLDDSDVSFALDDRLRPDGVFIYHASLKTSKLVFRVSYHDILLLQELVNRVVAASQVQAPISKPVPAIQRKPKISQRFMVKIESAKALLIDDLNDLHLPMFELGLNQTVYEISNWSSKSQIELEIPMFANYFNTKNSHWEPMIETLNLTFNGRIDPASSKKSFVFLCRKKIELTISTFFLELLSGYSLSINDKTSRPIRKESKAPYRICNESGFPLVVWSDSNIGDIRLEKIANRNSIEWRFENWRTLREQTMPEPHKIAIQFEGPSWESIKGISVDKEGELVYILRPLMDGILHRFIVGVKLVNKIKVVTIKSTKCVENHSNVDIEIGMVTKGTNKIRETAKIKPGETYLLGIESAFNDALYVRPYNFGYHWSTQSMFWKDLMGSKKKVTLFLVDCDALESGIQQFTFQLNFEIHNNDRSYPEATFKFMAPFILENLIPYPIRYVLNDRGKKQQTSGAIESGDRAYLHTLNPSNLLALNMSIPQKDLQQNEPIIISSADLEYRDQSLILKDKQDNELTLRLEYTNDNSTGYTVSIYCPYIILNRTGIDLYFSAKSFMTSNRITAGQGKQIHSGDSVSPLLFSYSNFEPVRSRAHVKTRDSDWSRSISFEAVGTAYNISLASVGSMETLLGVDIQEGIGTYYMSKIVSFSPRFILRNMMDIDVVFGQNSHLTPTFLEAGQTRSLLKMFKDEEDYQLQIRLNNSNLAWSNPFSLTEMGTVYVKLGKGPSKNQTLIKIDIAIEKATIFVSFSMGERWPFRIDNETDVDVSFYQSGSKEKLVAYAGEKTPYAWDIPSIHDKVLVLDINGRERAVELFEIGALLPFKYPSDKGKKIMAMEITADATSLVLKLTHYDEKKSKFTDSEDKESQTFQLKDKEVEKKNEIISIWQARIEGIGISLISKNKKEISYISAKNISLTQKETMTDTIYEGSIKWLQIDNQLHNAVSPIVVYPTVLPLKEKQKEDEMPVFRGHIIRSKDTTLGVDYYRSLSVLLQELSVELDGDFLTMMSDFLNYQENAEANLIKQEIDTSMAIPFPKILSGVEKMYFESFLLQPIRINLSYNQSETEEEKGPKHRRHLNPLALVNDVLTRTVGNIHSAPIKLNSLDLSHPIFAKDHMLDLILKFYKSEVYGQVHKMIGSADFLGNPVGLFNNVASGVKDMFYEPLQGFEITKPEEFGKEVAKGASSLMKKTVFGVSESFSKITGSVGKGLSVLTLDSNFQKNRQISKRNRPKHFGHGVTKGAVSLAHGITSGVAGLVKQPLEGGKHGGVEGFVLGFGKGLLGVVSKPVVGIVDFASNVSEGVKSTTTSFDEIDRQRLPRFIGKDGILKPYSAYEALGVSWLKDIGNEKYVGETYVCHLQHQLDGFAAIVTETRLIMIHIASLGIEYEVKFDDIKKIELKNTEIALILKTGKQYKFPCSNKSETEWFRTRIKDTYSEYIQKSRPID